MGIEELISQLAAERRYGFDVERAGLFDGAPPALCLGQRSGRRSVEGKLFHPGSPGVGPPASLQGHGVAGVAQRQLFFRIPVASSLNVTEANRSATAKLGALSGPFFFSCVRQVQQKGI
jgi:hypothetical protein